MVVRQMVVDAVVVKGRLIREVARTYGVSMSWVYELTRRYREGGTLALEPLSNAHRSDPRAMSSDVEEEVIRLRKQLLQMEFFKTAQYPTLEGYTSLGFLYGQTSQMQLGLLGHRHDVPPSGTPRQDRHDARYLVERTGATRTRSRVVRTRAPGTRRSVSPAQGAIRTFGRDAAILSADVERR
jgi:transposase